MKTAKEYLAAQLGGHPAAPFISYTDALAAVQAVLVELAYLRDAVQDAQVSCEHMEGKPLADERAEYRRLGRNEMRARLLTMLPRRPAKPAASVPQCFHPEEEGGCSLCSRPAPPAQVNVFPPACPRCLLRRDQCICPPMFPREEPPF